MHAGSRWYTRAQRPYRRSTPTAMSFCQVKIQTNYQRCNRTKEALHAQTTSAVTGLQRADVTDRDDGRHTALNTPTVPSSPTHSQHHGGVHNSTNHALSRARFGGQLRSFASTAETAHRCRINRSISRRAANAPMRTLIIRPAVSSSSVPLHTCSMSLRLIRMSVLCSNPIAAVSAIPLIF